MKFIYKNFFKPNTNKKFHLFIRFMALIGIILACLAILLPLAVLDGFHIELRKKAISFASHLTIQTYNQTAIKNSDSLIHELDKLYPEIESITPVIQKGAIIKQKDFSDGIMLVGCDDNIMGDRFAEYMIEGDFQFSENTNEIVISQVLARKLSLGLGDDVLLFAIDTEFFNQFDLPNIEEFTVKGIYATGMEQYDEITTFISLPTARSFFTIEDKVATNIEIMLKDIEEAYPVSNKIDKTIGYPYYSMTVFDTHQAIFSWIDLQREPIPLVLGLIGVVAVFNIISILLVMVLNKTHSIGILRTIGLPAQKIRFFFLREGLKISLRGIIIGCLLSLGICLMQKHTGFISLDASIYYLDKVPVDINPMHYLIVIFVLITMTTLASLIPAVVASKISPIKAIQYK
ncbi:MAG: hypothetical protein B7C24_18080 [Bacteroidetes bacterium 4572_77]|nr:MAG: hypothetical protein B7C24_18080 [Bacteroidetes bacterium 4572_77]